MERRKCTLCFLPCSISQEEVKNINKYMISSQMSAFYLVHTILNIPLDECSKYLEKYGNPADWVTLCPKCSVTLAEAQDLSRQLVQLKNRLDDLKELMTNQIRLKVEEEEDFNEDYERSKIQTAAYEIRQFVIYGHSNNNIISDLLEESFDEGDKADYCSENVKSAVPNVVVEPSSIDELFDYNYNWEAVIKCQDIAEEELTAISGYSSPESNHRAFGQGQGGESDLFTEPDTGPLTSSQCNYGDLLDVIEDQHISDRVSDDGDSDYKPDEPEALHSSDIDVDEDLGIRKSTRLRKSKDYPSTNFQILDNRKKEGNSTEISVVVPLKKVKQIAVILSGNGSQGLNFAKGRKPIKTRKPKPVRHPKKYARAKQAASKLKRSFKGQDSLSISAKNLESIPNNEDNTEELTPSDSQLTDANSVPCNVCKRKFSDNNALIEHKYAVHTTGVKCPVTSCGKFLSIPQYLEEHIRRRHRPKSISHCSGCNTTPVDTRLFHQHLLQSPGCTSSALACTMCDSKYRFPTQEALDIHIEVRHTLLSEDIYQCPSCDKKYNDQYSLKKHEISSHASKTYVCEKCGRAFATNYNLKKHGETVHLNKEAGGTKFVCKTCERVFTNKYHLHRHEKLHGEDAPYLCTVCGKAYKVGNQLTTHMWSHDPDRHEKYSLYKSKSRKKKADVVVADVQNADISEISKEEINENSDELICLLQTLMRLHYAMIRNCLNKKFN